MPTYEYPRPALTVDAVIFSQEPGNQDSLILLIQRGQDPYAGTWALPGGFVEENEPLEKAVARELEEETGLTKIPLTQFYAFGNPGRDPRGWTVSIAFVGYVSKENQQPKAASDAASLAWYSIHQLPALAFDHADIIQKALLFSSNKKDLL